MKQIELTAAEFRARQCGARVPANKYHVAEKADRTADGIVFHSKKEMERYQELVLLRDVHALVDHEWQIVFFLRQVPFHLPGKTKWIADFLILWQHVYRCQYRITVEDVKGCQTEVYRLKKRQVEELYPIQITEL